jgi:hypothetical protein
MGSDLNPPRSLSEIQADITQAEAAMPKAAFCQTIVTV